MSYNISGLPWWISNKEYACNAGDWVQSLGLEDPLEKGMATPLVFLNGEFQGIKEPGRLQSMGLQRVRHC